MKVTERVLQAKVRELNQTAFAGLPWGLKVHCRSGVVDAVGMGNRYSVLRMFRDPSRGCEVIDDGGVYLPAHDCLLFIEGFVAAVKITTGGAK